MRRALCAGHLIRRVIEGGTGTFELNDAALAACALADKLNPDRAFLEGTTGAVRSPTSGWLGIWSFAEKSTGMTSCP